jgi:hypothetical protein
VLGRPLGLNHAFVYSEGTGRGRGMNGSSGLAFDDGNGVGDLDSPYVLAPLPPGMSEEEFMRRIGGADGWNNGVWCPFGNDCHSQLEDAFWQAGVRYPGRPMAHGWTTTSGPPPYGSRAGMSVQVGLVMGQAMASPRSVRVLAG